jgi:hypothetical protein
MRGRRRFASGAARPSGSRRRLTALAVAASLAVLSAFIAVLGINNAYAATTQQTFLTFYGWWDNTPPGGDISYPKLHSTAGGTGTYADPITFATSTSEISAGTRVYVPRVKKYFIMEDSCEECSADWSGNGPNGGPGLRHIDLWLGGKNGNPFDAINCEDALTHYNADNTPVLEPVIVSPANNEVVDSTPLFNTSTGACYGGAQPHITVGQYKNGSNGQCLDDPNNSTSTGTQLKTAACNGSVEQQFTFEGAFLIIHNLCAGMSSSNIVLQSCSGGPAQQWSVNPNGTISDIQTGSKCVGVSGSNVVARSCSGSASQWTFTPSSGTSNDFSVSVSPTSRSVAAGSSTTATVTTAVVAGSAQSVALSATGAPAGVSVSFNPASVTAGGTSTMTVSTTSAAAAGTSTVTVTGTGASGTHSATLSLTVTTSGGGGTVRYEAENATISQGILETVHTGYSGTGYVNCDNVVGSYVEFTVTAAAAGNATVVIRYSNGTTADRPSSVTVNGTVVNAGLSFPVTTDWNTWANDTVTVPLVAGSNTIRLTGTTANGPANIDYLDVTPPSGGGGGTTTTTYQAESATISQGTVATNHTGYTGTGFVDYTNVTGSYVEFSVTSGAAGTATVTFRFANGTTVNRPMDVAVNGTVVSAGVPFVSTGTWDTWQTATVTVPVSAGTNTVRATATTSNGGPNLDAITVTTPN